MPADGPRRGGVELVQTGQLAEDQMEIAVADPLELVTRHDPAVAVGGLLRADLHRHSGGKVIDLIQEAGAEGARGDTQCDVAHGPW